MATFVTQTYGNFDEDADYNLADGGFTYIVTATTNTVTLPPDAPVGWKHTFIVSSANAQTLAAPAGDTISGDTATAAAFDRIDAFKVTSTLWVGNLIPAT